MKGPRRANATKPSAHAVAARRPEGSAAARASPAVRAGRPERRSPGPGEAPGGRREAPPPPHAALLATNGNCPRAASADAPGPRAASQPMGAAGVALAAGRGEARRGGARRSAGVPGQLRRGPFPTSCSGEHRLGSSSAQPTDDGDSGRPAWPGVVAGLLLPVPHPHHPAHGPAGGAAARSLPRRGEGPSVPGAGR